MTSALADLRARHHAIAVAEADDWAGTLDRDPNDPEARGIDPDALYDLSREDSL